MKSIFSSTHLRSAVILCCSLWISCTKTHPADTTIPIKELVLLSEITLSFKEPSGIAFSEALQRLWVVSGGDQHVHMLDTSGNDQKQLSFVGVDLEGIAFDASDSTLWVVDEGTKIISHLDLNGRVLYQKQLNYSSKPNKGPEGITIGENHTLLVINEFDPSVLFELDDQYNIAVTHQLNFASDYSDISYDQSSGTLFILSDESKAFFRMDENIKAIEQYVLPTDKNEGIAFDEGRNVFYIVNDAANTLSWFKVK